MASNIDPTKPVNGVAALKGDLRDNLAAAKAEIEALQAGKLDTGASLTLANISNAGALAAKDTIDDASLISDGVVTAAHLSVAYAPALAGTPIGGAAGQLLRKTTGDDFDFEWSDEAVAEDVIPGQVLVDSATFSLTVGAGADNSLTVVTTDVAQTLSVPGTATAGSQWLVETRHADVTVISPAGTITPDPAYLIPNDIAVVSVLANPTGVAPDVAVRGGVIFPPAIVDGDRTYTVNDHGGKFLIVSGIQTFTDAGDYPDGYFVKFRRTATGDITVNGTGSDYIMPGPGWCEIEKSDTVLMAIGNDNIDPVLLSEGAATPFDTGFMLVTVGATVDDAGSSVWATPGNITADDGVRATNSIITVGGITDKLVGRAADLSAVPDLGTPTSITIRIQGHAQTPAENMTEHTVQLTIDSGVNGVGPNVASGTFWGASDTNKDFTVNTSLPTVAEIKAVTFGAILKMTKTAGISGGNNARVDAIWLRVQGLAP